jgi:hypothetical protein
MSEPAPLEEYTAYHKAYNSLIRRDYGAALSWFRQYADACRYGQSPEVGAALWMTGEFSEACKSWEHEIQRLKAKEATHTDGAGGVIVPALLWWAAAHNGLADFATPATTELKKRWKTKHTQRSLWPGSIANYILGGIDDVRFLTTAEIAQSASFRLGADGELVMVPGARTPNPILVGKALTKATFYISGKRLLSGDGTGYGECLMSAASHVVETVEMEWFLARYEVERLTSSPLA